VEELIPFRPDFPVASLITSSIATTIKMRMVHMALALAVRPSMSRKMISIAASFTFADTRKMTALIVVIAHMKKKIIDEKKAVFVKVKTTR
jgi:hypothetical protein